MGDLAGALADFDRALELAPRYTEAYSNRGTARHARGDDAGSVADFEQALEIDPRHAEAYNNRGAARHALGDPRTALADFDLASEAAPREQIDVAVTRGVKPQVQHGRDRTPWWGRQEL